MTNILRDMTANDILVLNYMTAPGFSFNEEKRARPVLASKVDEMMDSIKECGILHPIICATDIGGNPTKLDLLAGAHRLAAIRKLWATSKNPEEYTLPIRKVTVPPGGDTRKLVEYAENLHRNELTDAQRRLFAAAWLDAKNKRDAEKAAAEPETSPDEPVTRTRPKAADANGPGRGQPKSWFGQWFEKAGYSESKARLLWGEFCDESKRSVSPVSATLEDRKAFSAWLKAKQGTEKQAQQAVKSVKEQKLDLYRTELSKLSQKTGRMPNSIVPMWNKYWLKESGSHVKPSDGTEAQWTQFGEWIVKPEAQGGPKAPLKAVPPSPIETRWKEGIEAFRLLMIEAKAAGINVAVPLRDLTEEA